VTESPRKRAFQIGEKSYLPPMSPPPNPSAACLRSCFSRILKGMEVHFTPEQEAQLAQIATKAGTDAERLVKDAALRLLEDEDHFHAPATELPVLHLGAMKPLHRRDIYTDVR
jgi:hypothetical protein